MLVTPELHRGLLGVGVVRPMLLVGVGGYVESHFWGNGSLGKWPALCIWLRRCQVGPRGALFRNLGLRRHEAQAQPRKRIAADAQVEGQDWANLASHGGRAVEHSAGVHAPWAP